MMEIWLPEMESLGKGEKKKSVPNEANFIQYQRAGSKVKSKEVRDLINFHRADFCCIQESNLEKVDQNICKSLWGTGNFDWVGKASNGRSGGIIYLWNSEKFVCSSFWDMEAAVIVKGHWGLEGNENRRQNSDCCVCLAGDFNSIRRENERVDQSENINHIDIGAFDYFNREADLIDLPLRGWKFTCNRTDGSCKIRIDRILVCNHWMTSWPTVAI